MTFQLSESEVTDDPRLKASALDQRGRLIILPRTFGPKPGLTRLDDVKRVGAGVYIAARRRKALVDILENTPHIRFRRAREIPKGDSRKKAPFTDRIYTVVLYSFEKPTPQQKKTLQRLILKTPCIKLRPGVLLLPHLRAKEKARYYSSHGGVELLDSKSFANETVALGAKVRRWTRLRLINQQGEELIQQSYSAMVAQEVASIDLKLKSIVEELRNDSPDLRKIKSEYTAVSRRLKRLRHRHKILHALWQYEAEKELKRVYNSMLRVRRTIHERSESPINPKQ
jgi:hypothetical protein